MNHRMCIIVQSNTSFYEIITIKIIKSFIRATCFGSCYRAIFRLSPKQVLYTINNTLCSTRSRLHIIDIYYELKINLISNII